MRGMKETRHKYVITEHDDMSGGVSHKNAHRERPEDLWITRAYD